MTYTRRAFVFAAVAMVLSACASANARRSPDEPTFLSVDNRAVLDMTIYVLRSSERIRLGTANGLSTTRLKIPSYILFGATTLRFMADPIGATRAPISDDITVLPGDDVTMIIPPQ
jgi:hypothetical protein